MSTWVTFIKMLRIPQFVFYFRLPMYGKESIVLGSNFRNGDFDGFTH